MEQWSIPEAPRKGHGFTRKVVLHSQELLLRLPAWVRSFLLVLVNYLLFIILQEQIVIVNVI